MPKLLNNSCDKYYQSMNGKSYFLKAQNTLKCCKSRHKKTFWQMTARTEGHLRIKKQGSKCIPKLIKNRCRSQLRKRNANIMRSDLIFASKNVIYDKSRGIGMASRLYTIAVNGAIPLKISLEGFASIDFGRKQIYNTTNLQ